MSTSRVLVVWRVLVLMVIGAMSFVALPNAAGQISASPDTTVQVQPHHHVPAGGQALVCEDPNQKLDCEMYIAGFADTVNMMLVDGESTKMLCGDLDTADLIA